MRLWRKNHLTSGPTAARFSCPRVGQSAEMTLSSIAFSLCADILKTEGDTFPEAGLSCILEGT